MKIAELNIGLSSKSLGGIEPETALQCLKVWNFRIISYRIAESEAEGEKELCLACKVILPDYHWQSALLKVCEDLGQNCIALAGFIGHDPYDTFISKHWRTSDEAQHISELAEKTVYPWDHTDLVGICKYRAADIKRARFDKQIGGGKFNL